ncbi:MAG: hypothetical protein CM15mP62_26470 [Rhodospirillaceae bacterium]|nr:MAG: hypothetical protein CM15mP62_26470 [Rhodospirillaceae bacterium]
MLLGVTRRENQRDIAVDQKNNLRTNGDRLWDSLMQMAKIGPGVAGGNNRQALTDEDLRGATYLSLV